MALQPHVLLLKAVIHLIHLFYFSVHYREHSLSEQGFHFHGEFLFQGGDLFGHGRSDYSVQ